VIEGTWLLRAVTATPLEQFRLAAPADAGAQVHWQLPREYGALAVSVTNGEGYASREGLTGNRRERPKARPGERGILRVF
jgi:hypothetical protein